MKQFLFIFILLNFSAGAYAKPPKGFYDYNQIMGGQFEGTCQTPNEKMTPIIPIEVSYTDWSKSVHLKAVGGQIFPCHTEHPEPLECHPNELTAISFSYLNDKPYSKHFPCTDEGDSGYAHHEGYTTKDGLYWESIWKGGCIFLKTMTEDKITMSAADKDNFAVIYFTYRFDPEVKKGFKYQYTCKFKRK